MRNNENRTRGLEKTLLGRHKGLRNSCFRNCFQRISCKQLNVFTSSFSFKRVHGFPLGWGDVRCLFSMQEQTSIMLMMC